MLILCQAHLFGLSLQKGKKVQKWPEGQAIKGGRGWIGTAGGVGGGGVLRYKIKRRGMKAWGAKHL